MLKRLIACLACIVPLVASAGAKVCPVQYTFAWEPQDARKPDSGSVRVADARSASAVQLLRDVQNYQGDENGLQALDLNNDGCPDLIVTADVAPIGNRIVTVYLYDRKRRLFVYDAALSEIPDLAVDSRDPNCLTGDWKGGADDVGGDRYCWRKGRLVKSNSYSVKPLYDRKTGRFSCYEHVETTHTGGRKRVRKDCTKRF